MNFSKRGRTFSLSLAIMLAIGSSLPAVADISSNSRFSSPQRARTSLRARLKGKKFPNFRAPSGRTIGASRGGCLANKQYMTALLPPKQTSLEKENSRVNSIKDNRWLTDAPYPTVLFNLPENSAEEAQFWIEDKNLKKVIYSATFKLPEQKTSNGTSPAGVRILNLADVAKSANLPELAVGESYVWTVRLVCSGDNDNSGNPTISGWIHRIDPKAPLASQLDSNTTEVSSNAIIADLLQKAPQADYAGIYAENGLWYSALSSLAELRKSNPNNAEVTEDWQALLGENGLQDVANNPIVGSGIITKVNLGSLPE